MAKLVEFFNETKREIGKVTWPTQKEIVMTTILIIGMALVAGLFFFVVDNILGFTISKILGMRA